MFDSWVHFSRKLDFEKRQVDGDGGKGLLRVLQKHERRGVHKDHDGELGWNAGSNYGDAGVQESHPKFPNW